MDQYTKFAIHTAQITGIALMKYFKKIDPLLRGTPKEIKTRYDLTADKIIKREIEKRFPNHSYLTEETGLVEKDKNYLWVIDPLDGTGNFMNGNPFFSISISLWIDGKPHTGVIEAPAIQERFIAEAGKGAFMVDLKGGKRKKVKVSSTKDLSKAYLVYCEGGTVKKNRVLNYLKQLYASAKDMRKLGSAAIELAWVGIGRADAYITPDISLWDIAAGMLFVKEAGGKILDFEGNTWKWKDLLKKEKINLLAINKNLPVKSIKY